jgi:hypothetical protein
MRTLLLSVSALTIIAFVGCGPMGSGPMPPRLEADEQKKIDDAWEQALTPVDKLDRQATLDTLIMTQAFQAGVDRLMFHSEKKFSGGMVVMEIHFDRDKPNDDRFEMTVRDAAGKELRRLVFHRTEVETAYRELNDPRYTQPANANQPVNQSVDPKKREEIQKRREAIEKLFAKPDEARPAK